MNKSDLVKLMANAANIPMASAAKALDACIDGISDTLQKDGTVSLIGFGSFSVRSRSARTGRNPQNGQPMQIKASKLPIFKAGKSLKDAVSGNKDA